MGTSSLPDCPEKTAAVSPVGTWGQQEELTGVVRGLVLDVQHPLRAEHLQPLVVAVDGESTVLGEREGV